MEANCASDNAPLITLQHSKAIGTRALLSEESEPLSCTITCFYFSLFNQSRLICPLFSKQVPKEPKMDTVQKYAQYFACSVDWFNMVALERTPLLSINSFLLCTCLGLNTSLIQSHRSVEFPNLSITINFINCLLSTSPWTLLFRHQCPKGVNRGGRGSPDEKVLHDIFSTQNREHTTKGMAFYDFLTLCSCLKRFFDGKS